MVNEYSSEFELMRIAVSHLFKLRRTVYAIYGLQVVYVFPQ